MPISMHDERELIFSFILRCLSAKAIEFSENVLDLSVTDITFNLGNLILNEYTNDEIDTLDRQP